MGKAVVWVVILGALAGGAWWMMNEMTRDTGYLVGYAIGEPDESGMVQFEILTPSSMVDFDPPDRDPEHGTELWDKWLTDHYTLKDSAGGEVTMTRLGRNTTLIPMAVAEKANADHIAGAKIRRGEKYSIEVKPTVAEGKNYKLDFTAEAKPYERVNFLPNY